MSDPRLERVEVLAWHFTDGGKLRDGRPVPPVGEWLRHEGEIVICERGLHASVRLIDALQYAPGHMLHRVTCRGDITREGDKLVCRERRIEWSLDAEQVLRSFARKAALSVAHLWDVPGVVQQYLETGDDSIRATARDAARAAAWDAARDAAWDAAWAASWAAARATARDDAWDAARATARATARDAARDDAWDAARATARATARDDAWDAQNALLERMVMEARHG